MSPLEHLEQLAREGWRISLEHHSDRSMGAKEPYAKVFSVTALRVIDDATHIHTGRAETLAEAIERTAP